MSEQANSVTGCTKLRLSTLIAVLVAAGLATSAVAQRAAAQGETAREKGLRDVGFTDRAQKGLGQFLNEEQIAQKQELTDVFTETRGIRVDYSSGYPLLTASGTQVREIRQDNSSGYPIITESSTPAGGCVSYFVDGAYTSMSDPSDLNNFIHPREVSAIEVYSPKETPEQFHKRSDAQCETIVIWTKKKIGG